MIITAIHQIEITNFCNLKCPYCIHGTAGAMKRKMVFMSRGNWQNALTWVTHFIRAGTQGALNLAGIGESTLHQDFVKMLGEAREVVGPERDIDLATNGTVLTQAMIDAIRPFRPRVWVSLHDPARAAKTVRALQEAGLFAQASLDGALNPNDWGGQVEWLKPNYRITCPWLTAGWGFVAATGEILTCCLDASLRSMVGHVSNGPCLLEVKPWELCKTCYQDGPA